MGDDPKRPSSDWRKQVGETKRAFTGPLLDSRWGTLQTQLELSQQARGSCSMSTYTCLTGWAFSLGALNSQCFGASPVCIGTDSHGCGRKSSDRKAESCGYLRWEVVRCRELSAAAAGKNVFEEWNVPQHNLLYPLTMDQALLVFICIIQLRP